MPTRPLDSGTFFTSQSMVSQASVALIGVAVVERIRVRDA